MPYSETNAPKFYFSLRSALFLPKPDYLTVIVQLIAIWTQLRVVTPVTYPNQPNRKITPPLRTCFSARAVTGRLPNVVRFTNHLNSKPLCRSVNRGGTQVSFQAVDLNNWKMFEQCLLLSQPLAGTYFCAGTLFLYGIFFHALVLPGAPKCSLLYIPTSTNFCNSSSVENFDFLLRYGVAR